MSLFQKSVLNKYLNSLDNNKVLEAFKLLKTVYGDEERLENIKNVKEEQYQEGFLRDIFVKVLGYVLNPDKNFNLTTEFKNLSDSKKADGAILSSGKAIGVIELKSTKTSDLESIRLQAFNYKNSHPGCRYIITSNFHKLRFYIDDANDFDEFDLFDLTEDDFKLFYLYLHCDNILNGIPLKIKEESVLHDESISKQFYKDYSEFKRKLYNNLVKNNPKINKLELYKKSQKLIDRFLFIFFAEDRGLIPPNAISRIIDQWKLFKENDEYKPLYSRFQKFFKYLDEGHSFQKDQIHKYNGGLFKADEILDNVVIDDDALLEATLKLSAYDFDSDIDVNILGHIFEHSLTEIESFTAELEGKSVEIEKSKRKKDGVFYTPKYITKYIVDNTLGKLCDDKKKDLGIYNIELIKYKSASITKTEKTILDKFIVYQDFLLRLKILDPACGSGAFLNQSLEFFINEHKWLDECRRKLERHSLPLFDVEKTILEKNLYGVDINEESVEIAKLSLWLRTAQKGRTLNDLSENIKCGNSLIDKKNARGVKAFVWEDEFKEIMQTGGFDIVIGNPPYVRAEMLTEIKDFLKRKFKVYDNASDLFAYFYEKSMSLLKTDGLLGFISNTFDKTTGGKALRNFLQFNTCFLNYVDFTEVNVFDGTATYPIILIAKNKELLAPNQFKYIKIKKSNGSYISDINSNPFSIINQYDLKSENWMFKTETGNILLGKISQTKDIKTIKEIYGKCYYGTKTALNEAFILKRKFPQSDFVKPILEGKEIKKWAIDDAEQQLILFKSKWTKEEYGDDITEEQAIINLQKEFPEIINHLLPFTEKAKQRFDQGDYWWELRNCAYYDLFETSKIIFPNLQNSNKFAFDNTGVFINAPAVFLPTNEKELLCILNSKVVWYFLKSICVVRSGGYIEVKPQYFEQIPIPPINDTFRKKLVDKANTIISSTIQLQKIDKTFYKIVSSKFENININRKLENWKTLDYKDFQKEIEKQKFKISLSEQGEWIDFYEKEQSKSLALQKIIIDIESEIDKIVYELYGLTEEEINIVEGK